MLEVKDQLSTLKAEYDKLEAIQKEGSSCIENSDLERVKSQEEELCRLKATEEECKRTIERLRDDKNGLEK